MRYYLDFEKKLEPIERRLYEIERFYNVSDPRYAKEVSYLRKKVSKLEKDIYSDLTNWQRSQISRHLNRPHTLDYILKLFSDFVEIHGDRKYKDDPAMVCGFARFDGIKLAVIGHQKDKMFGKWQRGTWAWLIRKATERLCELWSWPTDGESPL